MIIMVFTFKPICKIFFFHSGFEKQTYKAIKRIAHVLCPQIRAYSTQQEGGVGVATCDDNHNCHGFCRYSEKGEAERLSVNTSPVPVNAMADVHSRFTGQKCVTSLLTPTPALLQGSLTKWAFNFSCLCSGSGQENGCVALANQRCVPCEWEKMVIIILEIIANIY